MNDGLVRLTDTNAYRSMLQRRADPRIAELRKQSDINQQNVFSGPVHNQTPSRSVIVHDYAVIGIGKLHSI